MKWSARSDDDAPKRARMMGRMVGGLFIRHGGKTRRCFCEECVNQRTSRAAEKRRWGQGR